MEINELRGSINQTATDTEFNTIKLLCADTAPPIGTGEFETELSVIDLSMVTSVSFFVVRYDAEEANASVSDLISGFDWQVADRRGNKHIFSVDLANNTATSRSLYIKNTVGEGSGSQNCIAGVRLNGITGYDVTEAWASAAQRKYTDH
jgi:hypothetical protein